MAFTRLGSASSTVGASSTSTSVTIPSAASTGDLLLLGVMARSAVTTPTGWTLLETSATETGSSQRQALFYKIAASGDPGSPLTVTQANSARIEAQVIAYSYDGTLSVEDSGAGAVSTGGSSISFTIDAEVSVTATSSASDSNSVGAWVKFADDVDSPGLYWVTVSFNLANTGSTPTEITFTSPWTRTGGSAVTQRRLGSAELIPLEGNPRANQTALLVLYGVSSTALANQASVLVLSSFPRRRVLTITD